MHACMYPHTHIIALAYLINSYVCHEIYTFSYLLFLSSFLPSSNLLLPSFTMSICSNLRSRCHGPL